MKKRPNYFYRMPDFDYTHPYIDGEVRGGLVHLENTYIFSRYQIAYNCDVIFVPPGCIADTISDEEVLQHMSTFGVTANHTNGSLVGDVNPRVLFSQSTAVDTAVIIAQHWGYSYYHAMIEDLPRLALASDFLDAHPEAVIISYSSSLMQPDSRIPLLNALLDLGHDRKWVPFRDKTALFIKKALIPTATRCGIGQPRALRRVHEKILKRIPTVLGGTLQRFWSRNPGTRTGEKKVIVVHKRAWRSLINHESLVAALRTEFSACCIVIEFLGSEPMEEYIIMHHSAKIIVGPHGAGLSNVIFAPNDAALVEIHPKVGNVDGTQVNECHQITAKALNLKTRMLVQTSGDWFGEDFSVHVPPVIEAVRDFLQGA